MALSTTPSYGADRLRATADNQTIDALSGNDWLFTAFNWNRLYGGNGHDRLTAELGFSQMALVRSVNLFGGNGNDWLLSRFNYGPGVELASRQSGGAGNDSIHISATGGGFTGMASLDFDVFGGTGSDNIWIEVSGAEAENSNYVEAGNGSDVVYIFSEDGRETGYTDNFVNAGAGNDDVFASAGGGRVSWGGVNYLAGGDGNDRLEARASGPSAHNTLDGGNGDDVLIATGDANSETTAVMTNTVTGGAGNDTIELRGTVLSLSASAGSRASGEAGNDTITSVADARGIEGGETPIAETALFGGDGDDVLTATTIFGSEDQGQGGADLYGQAGNDILRVYGGKENTLDGGSGDDTITGGPGADGIIGGAGADRLRGGAGDDAFVYLWVSGRTPDVRDTILDFGVGGWRGDDVIDVSAIDANVNRPRGQTFAFGGTTEKGVGFLWVEDDPENDDSLVMANNGGAQPLVIAVADGAGRDASDWSADDFIL